MKITGVGVYGPALRWGNRDEIPDAAAELEELGYTALWFGDLQPAPILDDAALLLGATNSIVVGSAVANAWFHPATDLARSQRDLAARFPGRFLLGLGISHGPLVDMVHPGRYQKPLESMSAYLDEIDNSEHPVPTSERALAALGPKMLELARDRSAGALPYMTTPEHTGTERAVLGPEALLGVEQTVVLNPDRAAARALARENFSMYVALPNYRNSLRRIGFSEEDLEGTPSDRLIDALYVRGTEESVQDRVKEHLAAGADHVSIQVITGDFASFPREHWRRLAAALCEPTGSRI
jgi:probable F420-dependent oxidoreductase